jgi:hypothetical protein
MSRFYCRNFLLYTIFSAAVVGCTAALDFDSLQKGEKDDENPSSDADTETDSADKACTKDADCDDGIECTADRCNASNVCVHDPDQSLCTGFEVCKTGVGCVDSGRECLTEKDCDDGIACTRNSCTAEGRCKLLLLDDDACDDEYPCMIEMTCDETQGCIGGFKKPCTQDEGPSCYNYVCSEASGECDDRVFRPGADKDSDGYCNSDTAFGGDDCNDNSDSVHPDAGEIDDNEIDDDCDGLTDERDED